MLKAPPGPCVSRLDPAPLAVLATWCYAPEAALLVADLCPLRLARAAPDSAPAYPSPLALLRAVMVALYVLQPAPLRPTGKLAAVSLSKLGRELPGQAPCVCQLLPELMQAVTCSCPAATPESAEAMLLLLQGLPPRGDPVVATSPSLAAMPWVPMGAQFRLLAAVALMLLPADLSASPLPQPLNLVR